MPVGAYQGRLRLKPHAVATVAWQRFTRRLAGKMRPVATSVFTHEFSRRTHGCSPGGRLLHAGTIGLGPDDPGPGARGAVYRRPHAGLAPHIGPACAGPGRRCAGRAGSGAGGAGNGRNRRAPPGHRRRRSLRGAPAACRCLPLRPGCDPGRAGDGGRFAQGRAQCRHGARSLEHRAGDRHKLVPRSLGAGGVLPAGPGRHGRQHQQGHRTGRRSAAARAGAGLASPRCDGRSSPGSGCARPGQTAAGAGACAGLGRAGLVGADGPGPHQRRPMGQGASLAGALPAQPA